MERTVFSEIIPEGKLSDDQKKKKGLLKEVSMIMLEEAGREQFATAIFFCL
jgi:hypothetical protein